jgi:hypothetical protein
MIPIYHLLGNVPQVCACVIIINSCRGGRYTCTRHLTCYKGQAYGDIPLRLSALCQMKLWHVNNCKISSVVLFPFQHRANF